MATSPLPDVVGWEVPRALDEYRALGIPVSTLKTAPPQQPGRTSVADSADEDLELLRVIAVRPRRGGCGLLVVCAEKW